MCAQREEPVPVQAMPGRYTSSTTRRWAIILQWVPRPSIPTFQNPCHARLKGDAKVRSGPARRGPGAVRWKYPVRAAQRARQPSCQTVEHAMPAMHTTRAVHLSMCCPPFRRRDMISLFPLLDQEIFSSLLLVFHFPFSLLLRQTRTEALHSSLQSPSSALSLLDALFSHPPHRSLSLPSSLFFLSYFFFFFILVLHHPCEAANKRGRARNIQYRLDFCEPLSTPSARLPTRTCPWWTARTRTSKPISFHTAIL